MWGYALIYKNLLFPGNTFGRLVARSFCLFLCPFWHNWFLEMKFYASRPSQEIVAEFVATTLATLDGREAHVGTSYEYLESYASKIGQSVEKAVFSLLGEIKGVQKRCYPKN